MGGFGAGVEIAQALIAGGMDHQPLVAAVAPWVFPVLDAAPLWNGRGGEELQALVKSQLRSSRVPTRILFKDALPYNETGKLLRRVVRAEFAEA